MHVKMMLHSCSCATAKVHSKVKAIGMIGFLQSELTALHQFQHLGRLFLRALLEISRVSVRGNQEVPRCVRKDIEDNKRRLSPKNDKVGFVGLARGTYAEHAATWIL
jgi:hypothetical protein